jgi:hypothetical protein
MDSYVAALCEEQVISALTSLSQLPVFSEVFVLAFGQDDIDLLRAVKQLKFFWSLPLSQLAMLMSQLTRLVEGPTLAAKMDRFHAKLCQSAYHLVPLEKLGPEVHAKYRQYVQYAMTFPVS